jgi:hypothetical protein
MFALGGALGLALLFALIAHAVTGRPRQEAYDAPTGYPDADRVRDLLRSEPPPRRARAEPETEAPEPSPVAEEAPEQTPLVQTDDLVPAKT